MLQITPHHTLLLAVKPADFRRVLMALLPSVVKSWTLTHLAAPSSSLRIKVGDLSRS